MEKYITHILDYKTVILSLFLFFAYSCSVKTESEYEKAKKQIKSLYGNEISQKIDTIYFINEDDIDCPKCHSLFSNHLLEKELTENKLMLINYKGVSFDIQPFKEKSGNNIAISSKNSFDLKDNILPNLGMIIIKENQIDTIINIDSNNIKEIIKQY